MLDIYGKVDILITNAGIAARSKVVDMELSTYKKVMAVNYFGQVAITKGRILYKHLYSVSNYSDGYATRNVAYAMNSNLVARAIERLADEVGVLIAKKWRFGDDMIAALEQGTNWMYDPGEQCDLVSVIITAKYHFALSKNGLKGLPKPKEVPSLNAVSKGNFNEEFSFRILEGAKE